MPLHSLQHVPWQYCRWISDIESYTPSSKVDYPIIADPKREIAVQWVALLSY